MGSAASSASLQKRKHFVFFVTSASASTFSLPCTAISSISSSSISIVINISTTGWSSGRNWRLHGSWQTCPQCRIDQRLKKAFKHERGRVSV